MIDFVYISIALGYLILLIFAFKRDLKSEVNRYFAIFLVGLLLWHVSLYVYLFVNVGSWLYFVGKFNYATGPIFSMGLLGFFYYFPVENIKVPKWIKALFWVVTWFFVIMSMATPLVDKMETYTAGGPVVTLGDGYYYYLADVFLLPVITLIYGAIKYFKLKGLNKLRYQYSFWVFVPTMIAFLISNLILPIYGIIDQFVWSPVFLFPTAIASFYAIAKYRFLDIRLILARAVAFIFFIFACSAIYFLGLTYIAQQFFGIKIDLFTASGGLILAIIASLTFQPIMGWLGKVTNAIFYKNNYDREKLLGQVTHVMAQTIELKEMSNTILNLLSKEMHLTKSAFLIITKNKVEEIFSISYKRNELLTENFEEKLLKNVKLGTLIFDELPEENSSKKFMMDYDITVMIPIKVKNSIVAVLILGPKLSGEIYDSQDINFLNIFASESGIAIQNAESFEQIKKFNAVLEKRVEERTHELKISQKRELDKARDLAKLKDEFVYIASHELRTPVTAIKGFMEMVTEKTNSLPADVKENLGYIGDASEHLNQLVNDLLEVSRADAGRIKIESKLINLKPIFDSIIREIMPMANKEAIKISFQYAHDVGLALVDDNKMKEVIMNLLSNAVKYNHKGGKVDVKVNSISNKIKIEVSDTGYGIPKDQQKKIFEKFFRASTERTGEVLGTGLGLFITRMLVEKMDGKINFTSVENKGTTFTIVLPKASKTFPKPVPIKA